MAEDDNNDANAQNNQQTAGDSYPANTPVAEMTQPQQTAYWKDQARKHEGRAKAYNEAAGGKSAADVADAFVKAGRQDDLEHELSSEADKREKAARDTAIAEADAKYRPQIARAEFKAAATGRIDADKLDGILAPFGDMSYFLTDSGEVDTAKVASYIDSIAPVKGNQQQRKGPTVTDHGSGSGGGTGSGSVDNGKELWNRRNPTRAIPTA